MSASAGLIALLLDVLAPLGAISVRRMFGGAGLSCDGTFFALIIDDVLYLRTDEAGRAAFEAEGLEPFRYATKAREVTVGSYYRAPARVFDDPDDMQAWARRAITVARQAAQATVSRKQGARAGQASPARRRRQTTPRRPPSS